MPSADTVMVAIDDFTMRYNITDSYEYLTKQLKSYNIKTKIQNLLNNNGSDYFNEIDGKEWVEWFNKESNKIVDKVDYRTKVGTSLTDEYGKFYDEYFRRKNGESLKVWSSAFSSMPDYFSSNMYAHYGRSGRGKSMLSVCVEGCHSALQGATVLIWSLEMSLYEILCRMIAYLKFRERSITETISEQLKGFETNKLLKGDLNDIEEEELKGFLQRLNQQIKGKIIIRANDDEDFNLRSCDELLSDIKQVNADVVFIDPIYLMDYEANTSKVAGGDVASTSKRLRRICGNTKTVFHIITQADEIIDDKDSDGNREIRVPKRSEVKKTKSILEDCTNLIGIDTNLSKFRIELNKGRNGGEGDFIEGIYLPYAGIIYEPTLSDIQKEIEQFGF